MRAARQQLTLKPNGLADSVSVLAKRPKKKSLLAMRKATNRKHTHKYPRKKHLARFTLAAQFLAATNVARDLTTLRMRDVPTTK